MIQEAKKDVIKNCHLYSRSQQVLKVKVLLIGHVLKTIFTVNFRTSLLELVAHGIIDKVPRKAGCLTLVSFLLLHPHDENNLSDNNAPENAPYGEDTFQSIDLKRVCQFRLTNCRNDDRN